MAKEIELKIPREEDMELDELSQRLEEMVAELGEQPLSDEDKVLLENIYTRLDIFREKNQAVHEEAKTCRQIMHMDDPEQDDPKYFAKSGKKVLQLQTLKSTLNNVIADQMLSTPEAKLLPETAEMQEAADDLQDMVHYVVYCANNFEQLNHRRCEDFYGPGTAVTQIAWDQDMNYGKGEIALIRWPIEAFLWDPTAEDIQDCRAVMKLSWHPKSFYRDHWPKAGLYVQADENNYNNVGMTEGQENADHQNDDDRALLIEYWWRTYDANTRRHKINVAYAAGHALLEKQLDVYDHGMFPFVIDAHDKVEGSLAGIGLVRELVPMMRYINRYAAYIDMNLRASSKGRLLIRKGSGINKDDIANMDNDIIEGDNISPENLQWLQSAPFNNMINQTMLQLQTDLKQDSGANQFTRGETTGGIVSGKAINSLIQAGGKVSAMRNEQLNYGFKKIVEQIIWLMSQFYKDDRVVLLTGRKAGKASKKFNSEEFFGAKTEGAVNPPPYTVQIEVSSRDPQRIANQNQMFMEAFTMAAQTDNPMRLSDLFRILNLDGKDKILPVIEANEHYQEQMMAMQQQIEQMTQQLEQVQEENTNLKQANEETANAMAAMSARQGGVQPPEQGESAIVGQEENNFGQQTGMPLPT